MNKNEDKNDLFYKAPKTLLAAKGYYSPKTGELIVFKDSDKLVYMYMLDRVNYYKNKLNNKCFESQTTIGSMCGMDYKTVDRVMKAFMEHSVITGVKEKPPVGRERWFYTGVNEDLKLWWGTKDKPLALTNEDFYFKKSQDKPKPPQPTYQHVRTNPVPRVLYDPDEDLNLPF